MQANQIPTKVDIAFARDAGPTFIETSIPDDPSGQPGRASMKLGFPPLNFDPIAGGGVPPWGRDFNGLLNAITKWIQWVNAGGVPLAYDAAFQAQISGYPAGAVVASITKPGHFWISSADNNASNPDAGGANWTLFPDVIVQKQEGNYCATDTGGSGTQYAIALYPVPTSYSAIVSAPIRFIAAHANSVVAPTMNINGLGSLIIINSNGQPLGTAQIARAGQICEGFVDPDLVHFQLTHPQLAGGTGGGGGGGGGVPPGGILLWGAEVPPTWALECNGASVPISSYPNLFNAIGWRFGHPDNDHFNLPDMRGAFVRGWDHGRGLDPDAGSRTVLPHGAGGVWGDHVGSWQEYGVGGSMTATLKNPSVSWDAGYALPFVGNQYNWGAGLKPLSVDVIVALGFDPMYALHEYGHSANFFPTGIEYGIYIPDPSTNWWGNNSVHYDTVILCGMDTLHMVSNPQTWAGDPPQGNLDYFLRALGGYQKYGAVRSTGITGTLQGSAGDTRPVNISLMYIIAF